MGPLFLWEKNQAFTLDLLNTLMVSYFNSHYTEQSVLSNDKLKLNSQFKS